jgi:hypothetical protein
VVTYSVPGLGRNSAFMAFCNLVTVFRFDRPGHSSGRQNETLPRRLRKVFLNPRKTLGALSLVLVPDPTLKGPTATVSSCHGHTQPVPCDMAHLLLSWPQTTLPVLPTEFWGGNSGPPCPRDQGMPENVAPPGCLQLAVR